MLPESSLIQFTAEEQAFYQESIDQQDEVVIQDTFLLGHDEDYRIEQLLTFCIPHTKFKADYIRLMMKQLYADMRNEHWSYKDSLMFQRI